MVHSSWTEGWICINTNLWISFILLFPISGYDDNVPLGMAMQRNLLYLWGVLPCSSKYYVTKSNWDVWPIQCSYCANKLVFYADGKHVIFMLQSPFYQLSLIITYKTEYWQQFRTLKPYGSVMPHMKLMFQVHRSKYQQLKEKWRKCLCKKIWGFATIVENQTGKCLSDLS